MTAANILQIHAVTAVALQRHEDRIQLGQVSIATADRPGAAVLTQTADRTDVSQVNARTRPVLRLSL